MEFGLHNEGGICLANEETIRRLDPSFAGITCMDSHSFLRFDGTVSETDLCLMNIGEPVRPYGERDESTATTKRSRSSVPWTMEERKLVYGSWAKSSFGDLTKRMTRTDAVVRSSRECQFKASDELIEHLEHSVCWSKDHESACVAEKQNPELVDVFDRMDYEPSKHSLASVPFVVEPHKALLYGPGDHFQQHVDTPVSVDRKVRVGTLVLEFCTNDVKGGDLFLCRTINVMALRPFMLYSADGAVPVHKSHNADYDDVKEEEGRLDYKAVFFSGNTPHEVTMVRAAYRLSFTFHVFLRDPEPVVLPAPAALVPSQSSRLLRHEVKTIIRSVVAPVSYVGFFMRSNYDIEAFWSKQWTDGDVAFINELIRAGFGSPTFIRVNLGISWHDYSADDQDIVAMCDRDLPPQAYIRAVTSRDMLEMIEKESPKSVHRFTLEPDEPAVITIVDDCSRSNRCKVLVIDMCGRTSGDRPGPLRERITHATHTGNEFIPHTEFRIYKDCLVVFPKPI